MISDGAPPVHHPINVNQHPDKMMTLKKLIERKIVSVSGKNAT
jgi:hypothetical protein